MFEAQVQLCLSGFSGTHALRISKGFGIVGHGVSQSNVPTMAIIPFGEASVL